MRIKKLPIQAAKIGGAIIFKILFYLFIGVIINWIFGFVVLWDVGDEQSGVKILLMLVFFLLFPAIYAWKARGYAITEGLSKIYNQSSGLLEGIVDSITRKVIEGQEKLSTKSGITSSVFSGAVGMVQKSERLPRPIRWVVDLFLNRIPLKESLDKIGEEMELTSANMDKIQPRVFQAVDDFIKEDLLDTGKMWFWTLLAINIIAITLTWYFIIKG